MTAEPHDFPEKNDVASALDATLDDPFLTIELVDGRSLCVPLTCYPHLAAATSAERLNWRLLGSEHAIEWPELDEQVGIAGLLAGRRSGESERSFEEWRAGRD